MAKAADAKSKSHQKRKTAMAEHRKESEASKSMTGMGAKMSEASGQMRQAAEASYDQASEWADEYAGEMSQYAQRQMRVMRRYFDENPLMLGVVGLGVGLLAGALIPVTRAERRFLRPLGRELREGAGDTLRQVRRRVDELAGEGEGEAEETVRSSAARQSGRHQPSRSRH